MAIKGGRWCRQRREQNRNGYPHNTNSFGSIFLAQYPGDGDLSKLSASPCRRGLAFREGVVVQLELREIDLLHALDRRR
jgi:hypothetical protein